MGKTIIHLKPYCKGCKELSVVTDKFYADNRVVGSASYCEHAKKCARIYNRLKELRKSITRRNTGLKNMSQNYKPSIDIPPFRFG